MFLCSSLQAMTFNQVIQTGPDEEGGDDKAVTAMGILNTIDTLLSVVEDHKQVGSHTCIHTSVLSRLIARLVHSCLQEHSRQHSFQVLLLPTNTWQHAPFPPYSK